MFFLFDHFIKIDWNINEDHRAFFSYQKTKGNSLSDADNSFDDIALLSHFYNRSEDLEAYNFQVFSDWTDQLSTEVKIGRKKNIILDIINEKKSGTLFKAAKEKINARKRWIAYSIKPKGDIIVDAGAEKALKINKKSLLPSGVSAVNGTFSDGDVVNVISHNDDIIGRGLVNYSSDEIQKIKGLKTVEIEKVLGYKDYDEVIHRDNLTMVEE